MKNGCDRNDHQSPVYKKNKNAILLTVVCVSSPSGISLIMFRLVLGMRDVVRGFGEHTSVWIDVISRNCLHVCHSNKSLIYCFAVPCSEASYSCFKQMEIG